MLVGGFVGQIDRVIHLTDDIAILGQDIHLSATTTGAVSQTVAAAIRGRLLPPRSIAITRRTTVDLINVQVGIIRGGRSRNVKRTLRRRTVERAVIDTQGDCSFRA